MRDRVRRCALLGLAVLVAVAGLALGQVRPALADDPVKVLLLLDVSGSMNEKLSSGGTKLAAAKASLKQVADSLPPGTQVGLRVYGSKIKEPKEENPKACQDTELVMPVGPLDRNKMHSAVDSFEAVGETPIAYSLEQSVKDLGDQGRRVVVLISDGEENCVPDPCPVAKKLAGAGVDLQFNAIGFDVNAKTRKQLQCIVDETDGSYYDAEDTDELTDSLDKLTRRALRPFSISGKPVKGGTDWQSAPKLRAGQYLDRYDLSGGRLIYELERTIPGSTMSAAMSAIVPNADEGAGEFWRMGLRGSSDGVLPCDAANVTANGLGGSAALAAGSVTSNDSEGCGDGRLFLEIDRDPRPDLSRAIRVELVVTEEPPITNLAELPPPLAERTWDRRPVAPAKQAEKVVGGVAFSDAPALQPGSYQSEIVVGETLVYQVPAQPGQRVRATLDTPLPGGKFGFPGEEPLTADLSVFTPTRYRIDQKSSEIKPGGPAKTVRTSVATPEIRIRNREIKVETHDDADVSRTQFGGNHYIAISIRPNSTDLVGVPVPVRLNLAVDGRPAGLPEYAAPSPSPSPSPPASASAEPTGSAGPTDSPATPPSTTEPGGSGGPGVGGAALGVLGILGVLILAGVVTVLVLRRRAAARAGESGDSAGPPETP